MNIEQNLCMLDRVVRGVIAVALAVCAFVFYEQIGDVVLIAAIVIFAVLNFISFTVGWCPVYQVAKITTRKSD